MWSMPRKPLQRCAFLPYHVTARANNREAFHVPLPRLWKVIGSEAFHLTSVFGVEIHAFVLMPNHLHALLTVPERDLGIVMDVFMSSITRIMNLVSGRSGRVFGGRYHHSLIRDSRYFRHVLKYVYRNPVRAGLASSVEDYPFSTLHGLLGRSHLPFPISRTRAAMELNLPHSEPYDQLVWLNRPFPSEAEALIRAALRKTTIQRIIDRKTRREHTLFSQVL
jgi:putative transposase